MSEFTLQLQLNYANSLPNFRNTFPMIQYTVSEEGPILITRRRVIISSASIFRQEMTTESIDHIMAQVITEDQWRYVGQVIT